MNNDEYKAIYEKYNGNIDKIIEETGYQRTSVLTRLRILKLIPSKKIKGNGGAPSKGKYLDAFLLD
jgi:hypothetical protein